MSTDHVDKKNLVIPLFLLAPLVLCTGAVWLNNVYVSWLWHRYGGRDEIKGILPFFDLFAVDYSTITTGLLFLISAFLLDAIIRKMRERPYRHGTYFAFRSTSSLTACTLTLGFTGTVYGLILIGMWEEDQLSFAFLTKCLNTALYSTLVALILSLFIPLLFRWIAGRTGVRLEVQRDRRERAMEAMTTLLREWSSTVASSTASLQQVQNQSTTLDATIKDLNSVLGSTHELLALFKSMKTHLEALADTQNHIKELLAVEVSLSRQLHHDQEGLLRNSNTLTEIEKTRLRALTAEVKNMESKLAPVDTTLEQT